MGPQVRAQRDVLRRSDLRRSQYLLVRQPLWPTNPRRASDDEGGSTGRHAGCNSQRPRPMARVRIDDSGGPARPDVDGVAHKSLDDPWA